MNTFNMYIKNNSIFASYWDKRQCYEATEQNYSSLHQGI